MGQRIVCLTMAIGVLGSGCDARKVPWSEQGPFYVVNERGLRDLLIFNHAGKNEAACVASEMFKDPGVPSTRNTNLPTYTFTGADFEVSFELCGVDADDLWYRQSD
jgi:hypothetical protein